MNSKINKAIAEAYKARQENMRARKHLEHEAKRYTAKAVAERFGVSVGYVYRRWEACRDERG